MPRPQIPLVEEQPFVSVPFVGEVLGICRASAYKAAAAGEIPTIDVGDRKLVPTAWLRRTAQLD